MATQQLERRVDHGTLIARLDGMQSGLDDMKDALRELTTAVSRLAVVEERQANATAALERAFAAVQRVETEHKQLDQRVQAVEIVMPQLKEMRAWVISGLLAGIGMIGLGMFKLVVAV